MKKIINVDICGSGVVSSGGEKCFAELVRQFNILGYDQDVYLGWRSKTKSDLPENKNVHLIFLIENINISKSKFLVPFYYFLIFTKSVFLVKKEKEKFILISHSDAWPDVIFSFLFKLVNSSCKWVAINHMLLPKKKYDTNPFYIRFYNLLNQKVFFIFQKKANLLVSVNIMYSKMLKKYNKNVLIIGYGSERNNISIRNYSQRDIDLCFIGRFYPQKGIFQIPNILSKVDKLLERKNIKLSFIFIGEINENAKKLMQQLNSLSHRFDFKFVGFKSGEEKYELLGRSKLFIFPSNFESYGIVYLDAISVGTPVIEYDLECFNNHKNGVCKIPYLNNEIFARKIVELLNNENEYKFLSESGWKYSREVSWKNTAVRLLDEIDRL